MKEELCGREDLCVGCRDCLPDDELVQHVGGEVAWAMRCVGEAARAAMKLLLQDHPYVPVELLKVEITVEGKAYDMKVSYTQEEEEV